LHFDLLFFGGCFFVLHFFHIFFANKLIFTFIGFWLTGYHYTHMQLQGQGPGLYIYMYIYIYLFNSKDRVLDYIYICNFKDEVLVYTKDKLLDYIYK
jgi:hypothetical protein